MEACPICGNPLPKNGAASALRPFCGERCRLIDLGRWLGETYRLPADEKRDDESAESD
jgi:hypothetical protein